MAWYWWILLTVYVVGVILTTWLTVGFLRAENWPPEKEDLDRPILWQHWMKAFGWGLAWPIMIWRL